MLFCYGISVLVGGVSHQYFTSLEMLNSRPFQLAWSVCVGTVTLAGGFIGSVGSQIARRSQASKVRSFHVIAVPEWFWIAWGVTLTAIVFGGGLSMKRPAADIFIAGVTQTPPTVYMSVAVISNLKGWEKVSVARVTLLVGAFLNAPLLPLYPLLVYQKLDLGVVNAILHCWLAIAWGFQAFSLRSFAQQFPSSRREYKYSSLKQA